MARLDRRIPSSFAKAYSGYKSPGRITAFGVRSCCCCCLPCRRTCASESSRSRGTKKNRGGITCGFQNARSWTRNTQECGSYHVDTREGSLDTNWKCSWSWWSYEGAYAWRSFYKGVKRSWTRIIGEMIGSRTCKCLNNGYPEVKDIAIPSNIYCLVSRP